MRKKSRTSTKSTPFSQRPISFRAMVYMSFIILPSMVSIIGHASEIASNDAESSTSPDSTAGANVERSAPSTSIKSPNNANTNNSPASSETIPTTQKSTIPSTDVKIPLKPTATPETLLAPGEKEYLGRPLSDFEKSNIFQKQDQVVPTHDPEETPPRKIKEGSIVTFHVMMKLETGKIVFDSLKSGRAWRGIIGNGALISGLDLGMRGMIEGQKRAIWIPAHRAYGANGLDPQIPPHSKIYAEVEILTVEDPPQ